MAERHDGLLRSNGHAATRFVWFALAPLTSAWRHRDLMRAVTRRELAVRFRGAVFGWGWAIVGPLITLLIYTTAFTSAVQLPIASAQEGRANYALSTFVGLIAFSLCAELFYRAPLLLHERVSYIKTSIFPSEILAWIAVLRALAYAGISVVVLLIFKLVLTGSIPVSVLLLPVVVIPLVMFLLGVVWCLAALGAFTRDLAYLMVSLVPLLMIASPVFFRISDLPEGLQTLAYLNPLAVPIEMLRAVLLGDAAPSSLLCLGYFGLAAVVFRGGFTVYIRYKGILADVI